MKALHQDTPTVGSASRSTRLPTGYGAPRASQKGSLRLFLDSADVRQWEKYQHGTLYGFTTNSTILERDNVPCTLQSVSSLVQQARRLQTQELQVQAWGGTAAAMEAAARKIVDLDPDLITVKLPCTPEGLSVASSLISKDPNVKITITGVYTPHQVLLAQSVGADYVAPYLGRMADGGSDKLLQSHREFAFAGAPRPSEQQMAVEAVLTMQMMVDHSQSSMRILVASIRAAEQMALLAAHGCNTFTFSPAVAEQLISVPETLQAAADFEAAAIRNGGG